MLGGGGALGYGIAQRVDPTSLPQTVAAFHSLVGLAAAFTAIGDFLAHRGDPGQLLDGVGFGARALATVIGGVHRITGSLVAFGKLQGLQPRLEGARAARPRPDQHGGSARHARLHGLFIGNDSAVGSAPRRSAVGALSGGLGVHMTASIGGADMPVVITVLNSYSGWALCAEGFMLNKPLLTVVGSLIGSSGAILTYIMCESR